MKNISLCFSLVMFVCIPFLSQSQIVAIGITNDNRCFAWKTNGTVSVGTSKDLGSLKKPYTFSLPPGKTVRSIAGMAIAGSNNHIYIWYKDGTASSGTSRDLDKYRSPYQYSLPPGKTPRDIVGMAISKKNDHVFTWFKDGTVSVGTSQDLDRYKPPRKFSLPRGKNPLDIMGVGISKNENVVAWYKDGTASKGTSLDLDLRKTPYAFTYPGKVKRTPKPRPGSQRLHINNNEDTFDQANNINVESSNEENSTNKENIDSSSTEEETEGGLKSDEQNTMENNVESSDQDIEDSEIVDEETDSDNSSTGKVVVYLENCSDCGLFKAVLKKEGFMVTINEQINEGGRLFEFINIPPDNYTINIEPIDAESNNSIALTLPIKINLKISTSKGDILINEHTVNESSFKPTRVEVKAGETIEIRISKDT